MLPPAVKAGFSRLIDPLVQWLVARRVAPSTITIGGLALVFASCAFLIFTGQIVVFCVLVTLAMLCDAIDGPVARASGRVTKFGAYLDALCDRYAEALVIVAVAMVTGHWVLSCLALAGSLLISYAKTRAAIEVPVSNTEWPDLMERTERDALYVAGLLAGHIVPWRPGGRDLFWWTLVVFNVLVHATVIQRMRRARSLIHSRG